MTGIGELVSNFVSGITSDAVSWALAEVGLTGTVSVGVVLTGGLYLWWGYRLHTILALVRTVGLTVTKHAAVSLLLSLVVVGALVWTGIIPTVNIGAALDLVSGVVP